MPRGGKRPGAGRKPMSAEKRKKFVSLNLDLPDTTVKKLDQMRSKTGNSRPKEIGSLIEEKFGELESD